MPYTGGVEIGTSSVSQNLTVYGNIYATGQVTAGTASDIALKDDIRKLNTDFAKKVVFNLNPVAYVWTKKATELSGGSLKGSDYGFSAQEVEKLLPQAIGTI